MPSAVDQVRKFVPVRYRPLVRRVVYWPMDVFDGVTGRRDPMTPPRGLIFIGRGDFKSVGRRFLRNFIELADLKPHERVLDLGCGLGRMALPLTDYLDAQGSYEGMDIVPAGIKWCQQKITARYPNFRFQVADLYNKMYNRRGRYRCHEYVFPYADASFDFIFLTSVFTHMLPADVEQYLRQMHRVLKPGGRCLCTFYLLNDRSLDRIAAKQTRMLFVHQHEAGCRLLNASVPEEAIAYPESKARELFARTGFTVRESIHYGRWCVPGAKTGYQDIIVADKLSA